MEKNTIKPADKVQEAVKTLFTAALQAEMSLRKKENCLLYLFNIGQLATALLYSRSSHVVYDYIFQDKRGMVGQLTEDDVCIIEISPKDEPEYTDVRLVFPALAVLKPKSVQSLNSRHLSPERIKKSKPVITPEEEKRVLLIKEWAEKIKEESDSIGIKEESFDISFGYWLRNISTIFADESQSLFTLQTVLSTLRDHLDVPIKEVLNKYPPKG